MKNKFSALIAALIFTSPLSYAAEKIKTITPSNNTICDDHGCIDYSLWGVSTNAVDFYGIEKKRLDLEAEQKLIEAAKQINRLRRYHKDTIFIDFINGSYDPNIHIFLKEFNQNPTVECFIDYLGREYKDIPLRYVISRFGNLGFGSELVYLGNEYDYKLRPILGNITIIYAGYFPPKSQQIINNSYIPLNGKECLLEKTKFIHFVEDTIVKSLYESDNSDRKDFYNYSKLIALFVFLAKDDKYRALIFDDWGNYLNNKKDSQWVELLSKNPEMKSKIKNDVKKFIDKILCAKNYYYKYNNNKK